MLKAFAAEELKVEPGSWKHLIGRYLSDDYSPFQDLKGNTKIEYRRNITRWEDAIGTAIVQDATLPVTKAWLRAMIDNGRTPAYRRRQSTMLRILVGYGVSIQFTGAREVNDVLSKMRVKGSRPRSVAPTEAQIAGR